MSATDWSKVYPLLWTYRPARGRFADPASWRKAVQSQAKAAAVDAVARAIPQPTADGRGLFVSADPLGLLWKFRPADEKRSMWANWLASQWITEQAKIEQVVPKEYTPDAPLRKAAEQQTAAGGFGIPWKLLLVVGLGVFGWKNRAKLLRVFK